MNTGAVGIGEIILTPAEAACALAIPERTLRRKAREIGACHIFGNAMRLTGSDIRAILEATRPCPSLSTGAKAGRSGTLGAQLPEGDYADLQKRLTKLQPSASRPKRKIGNGKVISMDRVRS